jgi:hypothetical protein
LATVINPKRPSEGKKYLASSRTDPRRKLRWVAAGRWRLRSDPRSRVASAGRRAKASHRTVAPDAKSPLTLPEAPPHPAPPHPAPSTSTHQLNSCLTWFKPGPRPNVCHNHPCPLRTIGVAIKIRIAHGSLGREQGAVAVVRNRIICCRSRPGPRAKMVSE